MSDAQSDLVWLSYDVAEEIWHAWTPGDEDILAHAAFERTLRWAIGLEDDGLYFRPGGWSVNLPATLARLACAAAILAAGFEVAGLEDLGREIIIAAAGLVSSMDIRPAKLAPDDNQLIERMREYSLEGVAVSAKEVRRLLPRRMRQRATKEQVRVALDRLVAAGVADHSGSDEYTLRASGSEAWIRISLRTPTN